MKIQHKVTLLISAVFMVFLLFFVGYQYIRSIENSLYRDSKLQRDAQIIDKVLEFKAKNYVQATADNGAWDEMVDFVRTKDSGWAIDNFATILSSYEMSGLTAYDLNCVPVYAVIDSLSHSLLLGPAEIKSLFDTENLVHYFYRSEDGLCEIFGATIVPVSDADRNGIASGYLVSTKLWDESYLSDLENLTGFNIHISYPTEAVKRMGKTSDTIVKFTTGIDGGNLARIDFFRADSNDDKLNSLHYIVGGALILLIMIVLFISLLMRKWLSRPLGKIIRALVQGESADTIDNAKNRNEFDMITTLIDKYNLQQQTILNAMKELAHSNQALQEANHFSEIIYKVTPSAIFTVDTNKIITSWNNKAAMITGYTSEETIGRGCDEFSLSPCDVGCGLYNPDMPKPLNGRECTLRHKSGRKISILKNVDLLKDNDGKIIGGIESFEDVTERKRMDKELRESELRYSTLVKRMPNMMLIHSNGKLLYINEAAENVVGYSIEELMGTDIFCYLTPESQQIVASVMKKRAAGEKNIRDYELQVITKSGEIKDLIIKTEVITYDSAEAVLSILIDITDRKQYEKSILERELKLNTITNSAQDAIIMIDNRGLISFWNPAAEQIFGYSEEEIMEKSFHDIIAPERFRQAHTAAFKEFRTTGKGNVVGETIELSAVRKDGQEIDVELSLSAIQLNGAWSALGIVRDITERKRDELALQHAKEEAEHANQAKSEFLAMMSHEIRTPMNAVIGMTELTLTTTLSSTQREYLESVQTSAYSLLDTINDILDFSKIEAGKLEIEHIEFNLREMVERSVDILNVKAFAKNIELLLEFESTLPNLLVGDTVRIRQILINLIGNAIKFTDKGEICVSVFVNHEASATSGNPAAIRVQFSVRDTGIGIPKSQLKKVFSSFEQADRSTTRKYGGTGLGLSISKSLVEMMDGEIWAKSEVGIGSTFSFEIPLLVSERKSTLRKKGVDRIKNVLVVDDNETNLKIMHDMLEYWGISSTTISSGASALEMLKESALHHTHFDMVILDMHMPEMDGITVAEKIRKELHLENEPMILMFSSIEKELLRTMGKKAGIDRHLTKPVKMHELYDLLKHVTDNTIEEVGTYDTNQIEEITLFPGKTILVAEDNSFNMKLMNALLVKTGVKILNAANGSEAIDIYQDHKPDLILMDVHMPVLDGFEATRRIRAMEGGSAHVTIVALTAIAMQGDRERCLDSGMDDYLSKPFRNTEFNKLLKKYLTDDEGVPGQDSPREKIRVENETIFDKEAFLGLIGHNQEMYEELLGHYKELFPDLMQRLNAAVEQSDYEQIAYCAHTMKGMSGNIHANRVRHLAKHIEEEAKNKMPAKELAVYAAQLQKEYSEFLGVL